MNTDSKWSEQVACACPLGFGSLSNTTPVSLLANEFDVQSVLQRQVSTAVNQICDFHEAMNSCKNLKIH